MNDLESKSPSTGAPSVDSTGCVQRQLNLLLLSLIILSGTFAVFEWRQVKYARQDLEALKQPAAFMLQSYNQEKPAVDALLAKLSEFGRTNKSFVPILLKYQIPTVAATSASPAAAAPAATKPAPKPAATPAPVPKK